MVAAEAGNEEGEGGDGDGLASDADLSMGVRSGSARDGDDCLGGPIWPAILAHFLQVLSFATVIPYLSLVAALAPWSQQGIRHCPEGLGCGLRVNGTVNGTAEAGPVGHGVAHAGAIGDGDALIRSQEILSVCHAIAACTELATAALIGVLCDRIGVRYVAIVGQVGNIVKAVTVFLCAPSEGRLGLLRIDNVFFALAGSFALSGLFGATGIPVHTFVAKRSPLSLRSWNFARLAAASGLGFFLGQTMNVAIAELVGKHELRIPLFVAALLSVASLVVICCTWPSHVSNSDDPAPWSDALPWLLVKRTLCTSSNLIKYGAMTFIDGFGMDMVYSAFMVFGRKVYHFDTEQLAIFLLLMGGGLPIVMTTVLPAMLKYKGELFTLKFGSVMLLAVNVTMCLIGLTPHGWLMMVAVPFFPLSHLMGPVLLAFATRELPNDELGRLSGAMAAVGTCAKLVAPLLTAFVMRRTIDGPFPSALYLVAAVVTMPGIALAWFVHPKEAPHEKAEHSEVQSSDSEVEDVLSPVARGAGAQE